jgi:hypothetical protein
VFLSTADSPSTLISQYCRADSSGAVSEATVLPDIRRYLDQIAVAKPTISSWPQAHSLVNLPTFFATSTAQPGDRTFGGVGYSMTLTVNPASYDWTFGDGATLSTTEPGAGPPDGVVRHTYQTHGTRQVELSIGYGATYSIVTPGGSIGPLEVPGEPVRSGPSVWNLTVDESLATLTS